MRQIMVFAVAPEEIKKGIDDHRHAILRSCIHSALERVVKLSDAMPGLESSIADALRLKTLTDVVIPPGEEVAWRDQIESTIARYREGKAAEFQGAAREEARTQAQKTRERLATVMIQIEQLGNASLAFRVVHAKSDSILAAFDAENRRSVAIELGETEIEQLIKAYGSVVADPMATAQPAEQSR